MQEERRDAWCPQFNNISDIFTSARHSPPRGSITLINWVNIAFAVSVSSQYLIQIELNLSSAAVALYRVVDKICMIGMMNSVSAMLVRLSRLCQITAHCWTRS